MIRSREKAMEKTIDARGKACPQPVLMTKDAIEAMGEGILTVLIDSEVSRDNVLRFAASQGCMTEVEAAGGDFSVKVTKGNPEAKGEDKEGVLQAQKASNIVVFINSNTMGKGDDDLGAILMKAFIKTLKDVEPLPARIIFVNSGVFLTTEGSEVIPDIKGLEEMGIEILSCGTCLDFFHRKESLKVGIVSNMYDIASSLIQADRVVKP
jgi:selenium metabolism protein YedF